jgi:hypothetical protein
MIKFWWLMTYNTPQGNKADHCRHQDITVSAEASNGERHFSRLLQVL